MAVLSVMAIEGDADALAAKMRDTIAPVAARKASLQLKRYDEVRNVFKVLLLYFSSASIHVVGRCRSCSLQRNRS